MEFQSAPLQVTIDRGTVYVIGEVDISTAPEMEQALMTCIGCGCESPILDLSGVTYFDSSGIQALLRAKANMLDGQGPLRITGLNQHTDRIFRLVGLERFFDIERPTTRA